MNRNILKIIAGLATLGVVVAVVALAYIYFSGGSGKASEEISAPTLEAAVSGQVFRLISEESEVRFTLNEELQGQPKTVVGRTNQVAGDILIDRNTPANSQVGTIRINMRTLSTDNEMRNRAIRGQILESAKDEYEFTEYVPTRVEGLPESVAVGDTFSFTVVGNLTVRNITTEVTFQTSVTAISEMQITGTASAQVLRSDFELQIPNVPGVANVTNEVLLEIDFVAELVTEDTAPTPTPGA
jgi:polyisoprenoid-binding protein YceI